MAWRATPRAKRGRAQTSNDAAILLCLTTRCLFGLESRQLGGSQDALFHIAGEKSDSAALRWPSRVASAFILSQIYAIQPDQSIRAKYSRRRPAHLRQALPLAAGGRRAVRLSQPMHSF
ncbi:transposase [Chromobacterium sphagni]|uniref:transposase n=1 Tax=Chromobacterium sphagni TaxID=1903179 RepID=UPI0009F52A1E